MKFRAIHRILSDQSSAFLIAYFFFLYIHLAFRVLSIHAYPPHKCESCPLRYSHTITLQHSAFCAASPRENSLSCKAACALS